MAEKRCRSIADKRCIELTRCGVSLADRTVRYHLDKLGLSRIRDSLPKLLAGARKDPDPSC